MMKNKTLKYIFQALGIAIFGYILLNFVFVFDFVFQNLIDSFVRLFAQIEGNRIWPWYPTLKHFLFVLIIFVISPFIFKSKIKTIYKAIFFTVPLAVIYVTIGMFLYRWPVAVYILSAYFFFGTLYFFYRKKLSWIYTYTTILVTLALLLMNLSGAQI